MGQIRTSDDAEVMDYMVSQAVELLDLDETELYERLGLSFALWEKLQDPNLGVPLEKQAPRPPYGFADEPITKGVRLFKMEFIRALTEDLTKEGERPIAENLTKKGEAYFKRFRRKLFQRICVEKEACKWRKELLGDSKPLLRELIPLVGIALGFTVPAIAITVTILIVKWGIIKFCKCPEP